MMTDERLYDLFEGYERAVDPSPEFLDRLALELRRRAGLDRPPMGWRLQTVSDALSPRLLPPVRVAWTVALVALLTALAVGAALLGSQLLLRPAPEELVRLSQATYADPPAFEMDAALTTLCPAFVRDRTDRGDHCVVRVSYDGAGRLRIDQVGGTDGAPAAGGFLVRDRAREGWFNAAEAGANTWWQQDLSTERASIVAEYPLLGVEPDWIGGVPIAAGAPIPWPTCPDGWQAAEEVEIAGRAADAVRCGASSWWIDRGSGLLLRHAEGERVWGEVWLLDLNPVFPAERFALSPPPGARVVGGEDPAAQPPPIGQSLPALVLPDLDGGTFDSRTLTGRPTVIYLWAPWCPPCTGEMAATIVGAADERGDAIRFVTIGLDTAGSLRESRAVAGTLPIAVDERSGVLKTWGLEAIPALILLDAQGRLAAVSMGPVGPPELARILDALIAGAPIPTAAP